MIVLSGFHPQNPVTFAHCYPAPPSPSPSPCPPPIRIYSLNNKSCVTPQITQTAYHLFIVLYHNNSSVRTKAAASQTRAANELGRSPDLEMNRQRRRFRSPRVRRSTFLIHQRERRRRRAGGTEQNRCLLFGQFVYRVTNLSITNTMHENNIMYEGGRRAAHCCRVSD